MILAGECTLKTNKYYFVRVDKSKDISWYLFADKVYIDGHLTYFNANSFYANPKLKAYEKFLVAASSTSIENMRVWGNPQLINTVVEKFNQVQKLSFKEVNTKDFEHNGKIIQRVEKYLGDYHYITETIIKDAQDIAPLRDLTNFKGETSFIDISIKDFTLVTKVNLKGTFNTFAKELNWQDINLFDNSNSKEMQNSILATKAKTVQQLRLLYDLSWYFDENGKSKKNYRVINTLDDLQYLADNVFPKIELWSVDIETTGLNCYLGEHPENFDHIVSIMMSWQKDQAIFIPVNMAYMINIPDGYMNILQPFLETIPAVGHNIAFDARGTFCDYGVELNLTHDTQQLNFNLNCHRAKFNNSLKYLEHKHFGVDTLELKDIFGSKKLAGLFRYLPEQLALIYACPDVDYNLQLFYLLYEQLPVMCRKAYALDMKTMKNIYKMDCFGNRVNIELATKLKKANDTDMELLKELIFKVAGQTIMSNQYADKLLALHGTGTIDDEKLIEMASDFQNSDEYQNARYSFNLDSTKVLANVMYTMMKYPVQGVSETSGDPTVDANALDSLLQINNTTPSEYLKSDIKSAVSYIEEFKDEDIPPLISKNVYNSKTYPLALLIIEYRLRYKRHTTFFKQLLETSTDGYYYTSSKMSAADTFRIINTIQTLQGYMKQLIIPHSDDHYLLVFDFSQIEYRYMAGMAGVTDLVQNLNNPRADFHRECCALLHNIKPWNVTNKMRKAGKSLNFAIPYGMGVYSIAQALYSKVDGTTRILAQRQLNSWQKSFHLIWDFLETKRDFALENGYVDSILKRRRYFFSESSNDKVENDNNLKQWKLSMSKAQKASIRRASGNFPIQSGAADLLKIAINRYRERLEKEGLGDLVITTASVHDELVNSVHKSVNPYFLYKIIYEECMLHIQGHPRYYAGISICDNWAEGKADLYEAPMEFVEYMLKQPIANEKFIYQDDAKNKVLSDIRAYMKSAFIDEFNKLGFDINNPVQDLAKIMAGLQDYFIREKLGVYYPLPQDKSRGSINKKFEDDAFVRSFEEFLIKEGTLEQYEIIYPEGYYFGERGILTKQGRLQKDETISETDAKTSYFTNEISKEPKLVNGAPIFDLDFDDDLDLENENLDQINLSLDALKLYEFEEGVDLFGTSELLYQSFVNRSEILSEQEDIEQHPEKYIKIYDSYSSKVRVASNGLYLDFGGVPQSNRESILKYLNSFAVESDTLGAIEIVIKKGNFYDKTGVFVKDYSITDLQEQFS